MAGLADHVLHQAHNNAWSNLRLLRACEALSDAEFSAKRTGFFPSIRATLNHILWIDHYYIDALERDPTVLARYNDPPPDLAAAALHEAQRKSDKRLIAFCERQTDASLNEKLSLPRPNRTPPPCAVHTILAHLFQHQVHHRGQAHAMLAETNVKPPQLDEFFLAGELDIRRAELRELGLPEV